MLQEKAQVRRDEIKYMDQGSPPDLQAQVITQLTPPASDKKNHSINPPDTPTTPTTDVDTCSWFVLSLGWVCVHCSES